MHPLMPNCPLCGYKLREAAEFCRRCGCHVLLLLKIQVKAAKQLEKKPARDDADEPLPFSGRNG